MLENFIKYVLALMPPDYVHFLTVVFDLARYGIRVDPVQWFTVLTGKGEGEGYPSVLLISCKYYPPWCIVSGPFVNRFFVKRSRCPPQTPWCPS